MSKSAQANTVTQNANTVTHPANTDSECEYTFVFGSLRDKRPNINVTVTDTVIIGVIDTCDTVHLMNESSFNSLHAAPILTNGTFNLYAYGSKIPLTVIGKFVADIRYNGVTMCSECGVAKGVSDILISFRGLRCCTHLLQYSHIFLIGTHS